MNKKKINKDVTYSALLTMGWCRRYEDWNEITNGSADKKCML